MSLSIIKLVIVSFFFFGWKGGNAEHFICSERAEKDNCVKAQRRTPGRVFESCFDSVRFRFLFGFLFALKCDNSFETITKD